MGEVTTVTEYVLVTVIGNCNSVTKKEYITQLETLIRVKEDGNKIQPETRHWNH